MPVRSVTLSPDGRTATVRFAALKPVMQMHVGYTVAAADGRPVTGSVYLTIHATGPAK